MSLKKAAISATKAWESRNFGTQKKDELSEKQKELASLLVTNGYISGVKNTQSAMWSLITGIPEDYLLQGVINVIEFDTLVCLVPTGVDNSHNYPLNTPAVSWDKSGSFIKAGGVFGNSMTRTKKFLRPATEEEIMKMPESQFRPFLEKIVFLHEG